MKTMQSKDIKYLSVGLGIGITMTNNAVAEGVIPPKAAAVHPQRFEDLALHEFFQSFTGDNLHHSLKQRVALA